MSARPGPQSRVVRKRLPWLETSGSTRATAHELTTDPDTPRIVSGSEALGSAATGDEVQPEPSRTFSDSESTGSSDLNVEVPTTRSRRNTLTIDLDQAKHTPAYKRSILQMINSLLRNELDLPLDESPPPRNPRRQADQETPAPDVIMASETEPAKRARPAHLEPSQLDDGLGTVPHSRIPLWFLGHSPTGPPPSREKKPSLTQLPPHLYSSSGSLSQIGSLTSLSLPSIVPDVDDAAMRGSLNRAVTGLENLMEEALNTARDAAKTGNSEDVAAVLNNATLALRKASAVRGTMRTPSRRFDSTSSSESGRQQTRSEASSDIGRQESLDTIPTVFTQETPLSKPSVIFTDRERGRPQGADYWEDVRDGSDSWSEDDSIAPTPPELYQSTSVNSIVRDFAYPGWTLKKRTTASALPQASFDSPSAESRENPPRLVAETTQASLASSGVLPSNTPQTNSIRLADLPLDGSPQNNTVTRKSRIAPPVDTMQHIEPAPIDSLDTGPDLKRRRTSYVPPDDPRSTVKANITSEKSPRTVAFDTSHPPLQNDVSLFANGVQARDPVIERRRSTMKAENRYDADASNMLTEKDYSKDPRYSDPSLALKAQDLSLKHPRRSHVSLGEDQRFSLGRYHKRRPIAREWSASRKRITAAITCLNTVFIGLIAGVYVQKAFLQRLTSTDQTHQAGEVPRIQYQIADQGHAVLYGNVLLFAGLAITTLIFWPLPLLHGRKPYVSTAFALMLPLQFPQALAISSFRDPRDSLYRFGLLFPRVLTGLALGFANVNFLPTLLDLYGASLMSKRPHQEIVIYDDVRRQGGGMGLWLGIWTFCFSSALAIGFCIGAGIIASLDPSWGFYVIVILLAFFLFINVLAPETRRSPYRRSIAHFYDEEDPEKLRRRVARGEVKLHIFNDGPKWWYEEVWAGIILTTRMIRQPGFFVLMCYMGWIKAQLTLVILLLGALLSRDYRWRPQYVSLAVLSVPIGAILALPLSKAACLSRSRSKPQRTDSMTFEPRLTWTSHLIQRIIFSLLLPLTAIAYCLAAPGPRVHWAGPVVLAGAIGFLTDLGIAECIGLIMETFDTCDLQPGVNTRHRLVSLDPTAKRRRTNYSSFPRVCAAFFAADALGFLLSAVATGVSGTITRAYGAQTAIAIVAAVLFATTLCLLAVLWRWREVQVVPNYTAGATLHGTAMWTGPGVSDPAWKPVIVGNPSGKMRRMNLLEMGNWSRWTEIRKLNGLIRG